MNWSRRALLESGRPVLIVPYIQKDTLRLDRVLICWDGGRAAARAVSDSLPFLTLAESIEIVTFSRNKEFDPSEGDAIIRHLNRHNLKTGFQNIPTDIDIASTILSYAGDASADLIVMGGYDHSPLRELVLGGVTRNILDTMTVPVLMSH